MSRLYLAYGSNLDLDQMDRRCPDAALLGWTYIPRTRLIFRGSGSGFYLSIEPVQNRCVPCGVFRISERDELRLDTYEGYPHFYRKKIYTGLKLYTMDGQKRSGTLEAMAYVLPIRAAAGMPSNAYIHTCLQGYEDFAFDPNWLEEAIMDTWKEITR